VACLVVLAVVVVGTQMAMRSPDPASPLLDTYMSAADEARTRVADGGPPAYVVRNIVLYRAAEAYIDMDLSGPNIGRVGASWPCDEEVTEESLRRGATSRPNIDPESWAVVAGATYGAYCLTG
jgi:hypothetical protein